MQVCLPEPVFCLPSWTSAERRGDPSCPPPKRTDGRPVSAVASFSPCWGEGNSPTQLPRTAAKVGCA
eukprot:2733103-Pyramimonas_sp.AAC.1